MHARAAAPCLRVWRRRRAERAVDRRAPCLTGRGLASCPRPCAREPRSIAPELGSVCVSRPWPPVWLRAEGWGVAKCRGGAKELNVITSLAVAWKQYIVEVSTSSYETGWPTGYASPLFWAAGRASYSSRSPKPVTNLCSPGRLRREASAGVSLGVRWSRCARAVMH